MITIKNAEDYLRQQLGPNTEDIRKVWEEFKLFAKKTVIGEEEKAILFQCGVYDFEGEELFHYDFVRQFVDEENGGYQQLHCEFVFKPTKELRECEEAEWHFDTDGEIEEFFHEIEKLQAFQIPLGYKPLRFELYQEEI